jgi:hypothetical protein
MKGSAVHFARKGERLCAAAAFVPHGSSIVGALDGYPFLRAGRAFPFAPRLVLLSPSRRGEKVAGRPDEGQFTTKFATKFPGLEESSF